MRALQMLLLAALVVVLSVIAIDLHRLVGTLQPNGATMTYLFGSPDGPVETRAQRDARHRRDVDDIIESWKSDTTPTPRTPAKSSVASAH